MPGKGLKLQVHLQGDFDLGERPGATPAIHFLLFLTHEHHIIFVTEIKNSDQVRRRVSDTR
jgi:hypothetical protein